MRVGNISASEWVSRCYEKDRALEGDFWNGRFAAWGTHHHCLHSLLLIGLRSVRRAKTSKLPYLCRYPVYLEVKWLGLKSPSHLMKLTGFPVFRSLCIIPYFTKTQNESRARKSNYLLILCQWSQWVISQSLTARAGCLAIYPNRLSKKGLGKLLFCSCFATSINIKTNSSSSISPDTMKESYSQETLFRILLNAQVFSFRIDSITSAP